MYHIRNVVLLLLATFLGELCLPSLAWATDTTWTGGARTYDWFTAANWDTSAVPTSSDDVYLSNIGDYILLSSGTAASDHLYIGFITTASSEIVVTGDNTVLAAASYLYVGYSGNGTFTVSDGASVSSNQHSYVGAGAAPVATAIVTGSRTTWHANGSFLVGAAGTGTLTISDGAEVSSDGTFYIGNLTDSNGTVTVTGDDTTLEVGSLTVGAYGTGTLYILDGAYVSSDNNFILANQESGNGTVYISGSETVVEIANGIHVARVGTGYFYLSGGATIRSESSFVMGTNAEASGYAIISGEGTTLVSGNYIYAGNMGYGSIAISDGAHVTAENVFSVAHLDGSSGDVVISGEGTLLEITSSLKVGNRGTGTMLVTDHAVLTAGDLGVGFIGSGNGTLTISGGASVTIAGEITVAGTATSSGTINIGSASGEAATTPGNLSATLLSLGTHNGVLVFNHTSSDYSFSIPISGGSTASILVESGFTSLTADSSSFTGTTTVSGGALSVNGSLGGTITVTSGGRLQGTGTMSTVVIESGGVFAPGNSVGTTTVASLTLESGSSLEIEIDGTGSDVINVTGTLTNNGGDVVITMDEDVSLSTSSSYNYLTYASLSGSAVSLTTADALPFLTTSAASTGTTTSVSFSRNGTSFASLAATDNQSKVASVLSGLTSGDLYQGLISVKNADLARAAYEQLSGALHANVKLSLLADNKDEIFASRLEEAPSPYVQAIGQWTRRDGHSRTAAFSGNSRGLVIGQERQVDKDKIFGFAVHYQKAKFEEEANLYADASVKSYGASLYGQMPYKYQTQLKAGLSYSYHDISSKREISISGYTDNPSGDYEAHKMESFIEAARPYSWGSKGSIEPYGRLNLAAIYIPGFKESGGEAALDMQQSKDALGKTAFGLRFKGELPFMLREGQTTTNNKAIFKANLGWEHIVGDLTTSSTGHLPTLADTSIEAAPLARDSVALGAQMSLHYGEALNIGLRYSGTLAASSTSHAVIGNIASKF